MTAKEVYEVLVSRRYFDDRKTEEEVTRQALKALKRQIPVKPHKEQGVYHVHFNCGECGMLLLKIRDEYCPKCGQMIDWFGLD